MANLKRPRPRAPDVNQNAFRIMREATAEHDPEAAEADPAPESDDPPPEKNPAAVALGRKGGKKGGAARAAKLTPEERQEIARKGAAARWDAKKGRLT